MIHVRGVMVLNGIQFVRDTYSPAQHEAVVARMAAEHRPTLLGPIREASWLPLDAFVAYLETARRLLAPEDDEFFRNLGRFAGRQEREGSGFKPMVIDPQTAMRLAPLTWRSFHDAGRLEIEVVSDREKLSRLYDFPASAALCERRCGAWETLLTSDELSAQVTETRCGRWGHPFCETHTVWSPR
jgi:hypothetical protein